MKKLGIVLAIVVALTLVVGCASSGGSSSSAASKSGGGGAAAGKTYSVDLNTLTYKIFSNTANSTSGGGSGKKNAAPLASRWDGVLFSFANSNIPADITQYKRVTINAKYYDAKGEEIAQGDGRTMVVVVYDLAGDLKGPEMGAGKNTPLKEFNVGGFSGLVSTDKGTRINLSQAPGGILLQAADASVKFIEVTQVTFHNGTASGQ